MGKRRDTTAGTGDGTQLERRRTTLRKHRSDTRYAYAGAGYNPVAGTELDRPAGHTQSRVNTMNNRRNGGGAMYDNTFKREGRAG
jgi:hypothetical protein